MQHQHSVSADAQSGAAVLSASAQAELDRVYSKISWRLLPFLMLLYGVAYIDRVNVSFAKLQMGVDIGITNTVFGLGAGIFFAGYLLFQVPSNYVVTRIGVRRFISIVLVVWGLVSCAMAFVAGPTSFYILRFALGVAEAGFFPAAILYLTLWYPQRYHGRAMAFFLSSAQIAAMLGGPLAGLLMDGLGGLGGLHGWQWLFLVEGVVPVALGFVAYRLLVDRPEDAAWLTPREKLMVAGTGERSVQHKDKNFLDAFRNVQTYVFAFGYFTIIFGNYVLTFWTPMLIRDVGITRIATVGYLAALPAVAAVLSMWIVGKAVDSTGRPAAYTVAGSVLGAAALCMVHYASGNLWFTIAVMCIASAGLHFAISTFWATPGSYRSGSEAAAGIAIINTLGALGGLAGPAFMGWTTDRTGAVASGLYSTGALLVVGAVVLLAGVAMSSRRARREGRTHHGR